MAFQPATGLNKVFKDLATLFCPGLPVLGLSISGDVKSIVVVDIRAALTQEQLEKVKEILQDAPDGAIKVNVKDQHGNTVPQMLFSRPVVFVDKLPYTCDRCKQLSTTPHCQDGIYLYKDHLAEDEYVIDGLRIGKRPKLGTEENPIILGNFEDMKPKGNPPGQYPHDTWEKPGYQVNHPKGT